VIVGPLRDQHVTEGRPVQFECEISHSEGWLFFYCFLLSIQDELISKKLFLTLTTNRCPWAAFAECK
jgi:hypothetical protein